jgi:hypothetical protein
MRVIAEAIMEPILPSVENKFLTRQLIIQWLVLGAVLVSNREDLIGRNFAERDYFKLPRQHHDPATCRPSSPPGVVEFSVRLALLGCWYWRLLRDCIFISGGKSAL